MKRFLQDPSMLVSRVCHWLPCLMLLVPAFSGAAAAVPRTRIALDHGRWLINGQPTNLGSSAEGLLTNYFPPPESQGGWRRLSVPEEIRSVGGMEPAKLDELRDWLLKSDDRDFAAVVIRHGYVVLQVERGNSAATDSRRVASVSKAVCATVLAIASEWSQQGRTPRQMRFEDRAFDFIPWAQPLSDPRKAQITIKQLLNHTSGICPEATGAPNDGSWDYVLGHTGDARTEKLAFDPGAGCGYSTHALDHAALVCETVTGKPYDQFAIEALFKPLGIDHWWFQFYDGTIGRHPSHGLGMPARDLARIAYCMLREGRWKDQQVIPRWFVNQTGEPTSDIKTPELRWRLNPQVFSHGWELPARHWVQSGRSGEGIPIDAREKPGSGGQFIAFVPSLDLVVTRQTGSSGDWAFEEYLRRACAAALKAEGNTGLNQFDAPTKVCGTAALVSRLSNDFGLTGQRAQVPRLRHGMGERLFTIDVFAGLDRGGANPGLPMVGRGDHDRIQRLLTLQEFPEIVVGFRFGQRWPEGFARLGHAIGIHVADGDDVLLQIHQAPHQTVHLTAQSDTGDIQLGAGTRIAEQARVTEQRRCDGGQGRFSRATKKRATVNPGDVSEAGMVSGADFHPKRCNGAQAG